MSSDEDDYMSAGLLTKIEDVKPGVNSSRHAQRMLKISYNRETANERQRQEKPATKAEMEKDRLEEGINKPIGTESKGFKLLSMMGYKPGMSLGRTREGQEEGIKEPISLQLMKAPADRTGVGHNEERLEKQRQLCEAHMDQMRKRARMEESLAGDFRSRKRFVAIQKQIISDIQRIRRACQELDIRQGKEEPEEFWFWPIYSSKKQEEEGGVSSTTLATLEDEEGVWVQGKRRKLDNEKRKQPLERDEEEDGISFTYSNGRMAPINMNLYELDEEQLNLSLEQIAAYMRTTHFYCLWCGCPYEDAEDLSTHCPGTTRSDHEE